MVIETSKLLQHPNPLLQQHLKRQCRHKPSSDLHQQRRRSVQCDIPHSIRPPGVRRVSEARLIQLLSGVVKRLRFKPRNQKVAKAQVCRECRLAAYHDVDTRVARDVATWQVFSLLVPNLKPGTFSEEVPEDTTDAVAKLSCFALSTSTNRVSSHRTIGNTSRSR